MDPEVLIRQRAHPRFDEAVEALRIGTRALARELLERRQDHGPIAGGAGQPLDEERQYGAPGHPRNPRRRRVGCGRDAEERHHLRAFLAVALIRGVPDTFVVLERADHRPDIVAGDRMAAVAAAAPAEHVGEGLVLRRAIDDVDRSGGGEDPAAYLEGSEMGGEQDGAASAGERLAQVLETLDAGYRLQPRRR